MNKIKFKDLSTPELCALAVQQYGDTLSYVVDKDLFIKLAKQFNIEYEI
jgi:hypothetical protein